MMEASIKSGFAKTESAVWPSWGAFQSSTGSLSPLMMEWSDSQKRRGSKEKSKHHLLGSNNAASPQSDLFTRQSFFSSSPVVVQRGSMENLLNVGIDHHKLEQIHGSSSKKNPAAGNDFNGCMDSPQMIGDFSRMHSLPLIPGNHADLKCISSHTMEWSDSQKRRGSKEKSKHHMLGSNNAASSQSDLFMRQLFFSSSPAVAQRGSMENLVEMMSNDSEINFLKTESPMVSETVMCELMNVSAFEEQKFLGKIKFPKHSKGGRMITYKKPKYGAKNKLFQDDSFNKENSPNDSFLRLNDSRKQQRIQLMDSPGCLSEKNSTVHKTSKMLFPDDSFNKKNSPIVSLLQLNDEVDHHKLKQSHGSSSKKNPAAGNDFDGGMDKPQMIGDFSRMHALPLIPGNHADLKCISSHTLVSLLNLEYSTSIDNYVIIDCRYPYEFEGGHIQNAKNICTPDGIIFEFFASDRHQQPNKRNILVFHCEFSSERAPKLLRFLRNHDRSLHADSYPTLHYPEIYLLHGGYKAFYESYQIHCCPQSYKPMVHKDHAEDLRKFRKKSKSLTTEERQKSKSNTLGRCRSLQL